MDHGKTRRMLRDDAIKYSTAAGVVMIPSDHSLSVEFSTPGKQVQKLSSQERYWASLAPRARPSSCCSETRLVIRRRYICRAMVPG
jgi:hypothetical protein